MPQVCVHELHVAHGTHPFWGIPPGGGKQHVIAMTIIRLKYSSLPLASSHNTNTNEYGTSPVGHHGN